MREDYLRIKVKELDREIDRARKIIAFLDKSTEQGRSENQKQYEIIKAKISDWESKRKILLELMINQLKRK